LIVSGRGEEKLPQPAPDSRWTFGSQSVAAGSLHCDVWIGPAAELARPGGESQSIP